VLVADSDSWQAKITNFSTLNSKKTSLPAMGVRCEAIFASNMVLYDLDEPGWPHLGHGAEQRCTIRDAKNVRFGGKKRLILASKQRPL